MVTLSLCMVVDNKSEKISACLHSIKDIADEIIIVELGEVDNSASIYSGYTKKIYKFTQTGDNSDAWNYCFSLATMNYILWLEPEDTILDTDREKLRKFKNDMHEAIDVVRMIHNFSDAQSSVTLASYTRNRIVKRTDYFVWQSGLCHYLPASGKVIDADMLITRPVPNTENSFQRFSVYEEKLEKGEKLKSRELFYYAEKMFAHKLFDKAIKYYEVFLNEKEGWAGDKLFAIDKLTEIYRFRGDKDNELKYLLKSFEYDLPRAEFLCKLGIIFTEKEEIDKAVYWFNFAVSLEKPKDNLGFMKEEYWTWLPHLKLCGCYYRIKDYERANKHNEMALNFNPGDKSLLHNRAVLNEILKNQQSSDSVEAIAIPEAVAPRPLKIIQIAPDVYPVPPDNYGGIEAVVYELTEELVKKGHDVYLYAVEGSKTSAKLIPYKHTAKGDYNQIVDFVLKTMPEGIDIIHDHTLVSAFGKKNLSIPTVCTIHGTINYRVKYPVFVSNRALQVIGGNHGFYVYNGLSLNKYEYCEAKEDYMLYLGRLDKMKGIDRALDVAEKTNRKLLIAGPVHDMGYYTKEVEPRIKSNSNIEYIGPIGGKKKQEVLKRASCLLFPTSWEEPFGLVMIEAMACGTPVLALPNGAVPEVLKDFPELICHNIDEMADKVLLSKFPSPRILREYVLNRFTSEKMAEGYLQIYEEICSEHRSFPKENNPSDYQKSTNIIVNDSATVDESSKKNMKISIDPIYKDKKKLRILQIAPDAFPCPPKDYGGIERVVYDLTEELVREGHEVFLYAAEGSRSSGKLISYGQKEISTQKIADFVIKTLPEKVDIIHDHTHACVMNQCGLQIPVVNTIHDSRKNAAKHPVYLCKKALQNVGLGNGFYVYNGISLNDYEFNAKKDNYLIFMGLLYSHKGINYALDVAEKTGQKLIVAGPIYDMNYYKKEIEPRVKSNPNIKYVGSVGGKERQNLLKNARCMVFPTVWEEPFGLVMIEAMACGTPVVAFANGAVPEVLAGFPDFICRDVQEMIHKVQNLVFPEASLLREYVETKFSAKNMADGYIEIYQKMLKNK